MYIIAFKYMWCIIYNIVMFSCCLEEKNLINYIEGLLIPKCILSSKIQSN
jgi:hypothetical protein